MSSELNDLIHCEDKDLSLCFRQLTETIQAYCTFRTLLTKYSEESEADFKNGTAE